MCFIASTSSCADVISLAWVSKVFASSTKLVSISAMRQELVLLVLAFFDARSALIPDPPRPRILQEGADEGGSDSPIQDDESPQPRTVQGRIAPVLADAAEYCNPFVERLVVGV